MKNTDILSRITALLNRKVNLKQETLENGTVIESDSFAIGDPIFAIDGENKVPLEIGEYTLADGSVLEVIEIGIINDVKKEELKDEPKDEPKDELKEEPKDEPKKDVDLAENSKVIEDRLDKIEAKILEYEEILKSLAGSQTEMKETLSKTSYKPTTHKPTDNKVNLANIKVAPNTSSTESLIMALLSK